MSENGACRRLWILEDDPDIREILSYLGDRWGYETLPIPCVADAWKHLEAGRQDPEHLAPHYILSDYSLLDGKSEEWMKEARASFPSVCVVCVSGSLSGDRKERIESEGILCREKPVSLYDIFDLINSVERARSVGAPDGESG